MPISIGDSLGSLQITALLGKGGMGEVYRARDTKLKREVAVKLLPEEFLLDSDRVSRFQREAEVLASLNHQNIAGIYDIQEANGARYLVLELVEGETLADRLKRGPIPVAETLKIAISICEALEAAHERGIIHRDLKPANIKITPDGTVKVLDFGLAKALESASSQGMSNSPTMLSAIATNAGIVLGTAGYMSPEQAKGHATDQRSDIFSFGCVLFEMLTGRQTFHADTVTESIAAILMRDPDLSSLPALHPKIHDLLRRSLAKNRKERWHAIADMRVEIESVLADPHGIEAGAVAAKRPLWKTLVVIAASAIVGAAVVLILSNFNGPREASLLPKMQFGVDHPVTGADNQLAISPDGASLVVSVSGSGGNVFWMRSLTRGTDVLLKGTESSSDPFWSPDGRFIGFVSEGKLKKIDTIGGPPQPLADAATVGGSWSQDGIIVFGTTNAGPLYRLPAGGGTPEPVTELDKSRAETAHVRPWFLPDGKRFLFLARSSKPENNAIFLGSLDSKKSKLVVPASVAAVFAPPRHLLFMRDSTLLAQEVDPSSFDLLGNPTPIGEDIANNANTRVGFSASSNGVLVYRHALYTDATLASFNRADSQITKIPVEARYRLLSLSPDGQRLAGERIGTAGGPSDIWILDLTRNTESRFTSNNVSFNPVWSPDGKQIVFRLGGDGGVGDLYLKNAGGGTPEELILKTSATHFPTDWSADGRYIVYTEQNPKTGSDIFLLPTSGDRKPIPFLQSNFNETNGRMSPDGKWMAYQSNETGRGEIYVQSVPLSGNKWKISNDGGASPRWRRDGKELFYIQPNSGLFAVEIKSRNAPDQFEAGLPKVVTQALVQNYDVTSNGQRVVMDGRDGRTGNASKLTVVINWMKDLAAKK